MRACSAAILLAWCLAGCAPGSPRVDGVAWRNPGALPVCYLDGHWYEADDTGVRFLRGDRYARDGVFVARRPEDCQRIDLDGRFVIPPLSEAHNHSVDGPGTERAAQRYVDEGIFYYKNPNSIRAFTVDMRAHWARPDTLDVVFSYGGLSRDEGHPEKLYRMLSSFGLYPDTDVEELDGNAFFDVETLDKLDARWPAILEGRPDFLKLYLLEHDTPESAGLSAEVFREIVARAKDAGLRTTVHVESVADLALAVDAGADEAAHLPAYDLAIARDPARSRIPEALVARMAARDFVVVTTTHVSTGREYPEADYAVVAERQADGLQRLHAAGVPIAIGSDTFFATASAEAATLRRIGAFDDATLLRLWIDTARLSIFPGRAIGRLAPGYEASFLALACNPFDAFECVQRIELAVKQQFVLTDARGPID